MYISRRGVYHSPKYLFQVRTSKPIKMAKFTQIHRAHNKWILSATRSRFMRYVRFFRRAPCPSILYSCSSIFIRRSFCFCSSSLLSKASCSASVNLSYIRYKDCLLFSCMVNPSLTTRSTGASSRSTFPVRGSLKFSKSGSLALFCNSIFV